MKKRLPYIIAFVILLATEIYIPLSACANIPNHVKAVAKITSYPHGKCPGGEIVEVLGEQIADVGHYVAYRRRKSVG